MNLDPRASFSKFRPNLQIAWDSVSLGALKACPRYYQLTILEGWRGKTQSHHLRYGQLYHRALEVYDHKIAEGMEHESAVRFCLRDLAEGCQDWEPFDVVQVDERHVYGETHDGARLRYSKITFQGEDTEKLAVDKLIGWWDPSAGLSEKKAKENTKTIPALFRTVIWYLEQFGPNDASKTVILSNGKPAVELSFRYEFGLTLSTGEEALHSGHLDRLVELSGDRYVADRKTTQTTINGNSSWGYFAKYSPDNQMTGYTFASKVALGIPAVGVIIDAAQIAKGFSRFERGITVRSEGQLEEWHRDTSWWIKQADQFSQDNYWPMNDTACDRFGGCPMRGICSKDPKVRNIFLASDFIQQPWDPLKIRGDI